MSDFRPIFVVGHPRSGTTMLASMLGRHHNISMPPETMFFFDVYKDGIDDRDALIDKAMQSKRVRDLGLESDLLLAELDKHESSMRGLLQSILILYCQKDGKVRPGEKTPLHLLWVPTIIEWFPEVKVICIIRDGRDVVNSLLSVPWAHNNIYKHCYDWAQNVLLAQKFNNIMPYQFMVIRYEDILYDPEVNLRKVCCFVGEEFQAGMLKNRKSEAVPEWERAWKEKAMDVVDKLNIGKWRALPVNVKETMNSLMKKSLIIMRYTVEEPNTLAYTKCWVKAWPYHPWARPYFSKVKGAMLLLLGKK